MYLVCKSKVIYKDEGFCIIFQKYEFKIIEIDFFLAIPFFLKLNESIANDYAIP